MSAKKISLVLLVLALGLQGAAQQDTVIFSQKAYLDQVRAYHPLMRSADIVTDMADPIRREARGGFDPVIDAVHDTKQFKDQNYYRQSYAALKIPTWYNIELKADYERSNGDFLDPSSSLPDRGLWSAGLSIGLGRGFVIDERRAALKQADIYEAASQQERIIMVNDLLYDASLAYLNWQHAFRSAQVALEGETLARTRLDATRSSWRNGDKPAIDTLEALISLQNRQLLVSETQQELVNAELDISFFLWQENYVPLELADNAVPEALNDNYLDREMNSIAADQSLILSRHPEVQVYLYKIESLEVDRQLQREDLKPDIRLSYNPLISTSDDRLFVQPDINDYKFGASVYYPLLQRKARGKVQQTALKIEDATVNMQSKTADIQYKLDTYRNNTAARQDQLDILNVNIDDYNALLIAEGKKFSIGESSLFLVNSREVKYLESQLKQIDTTVKLIKDRLTYVYVAGELNQLIN